MAAVSLAPETWEAIRRRAEIAALWARVAPAAPRPMPRFLNVGCSHCGHRFGPGDSGYPHCHEHAGRAPVED
jgi:hypothetical protein